MYTIASLHELRRRLQLSSVDAADEADLRVALEKASHVIESLTQRRYSPFAGTRVAHGDASQRALMLPGDLLELKALSRGGRAIDVGALQRVPSHPDMAASLLVWKDEEFGGGEVKVTGIWGWHDRWTRAWRGSGDGVGDAALSAKAGVITVSDADGEDAEAVSPRFQVGHLLRVKSEYMRVIGVNTASNRLRVLRGVHGTKAVAHARNTAIEIYSAAPAVRDLCLRYAEWLIRSEDMLDEEPPALLRRLRRLTA